MKKKLNMATLSKNQLKETNGGKIFPNKDGYGGSDSDDCYCGCYYAGEPGGSSTSDNCSANHENGLVSVPRND